jgi:integrase
MLHLFRRHTEDCKHRAKGRKYRACGCPLAVEGRLRGEYIRKALDLRNWEAAVKAVREMELNGEQAVVSVNDACDRFMDDCKARGIGPAQTGKYKLLTDELKRTFDGLSVRTLTVDDLREYREGWQLAPITSAKKLERLRTFFVFCVSSGWILANPAKGLKSPQVRQVPTLPYSDKEWKSILSALDAYGQKHPQTPVVIQKQLRALILLMRYSGLRISDSVSLRRDRITNGKLFLYQAKTGHPVRVPLPKMVIDALKECTENGEFYFWRGEFTLKSKITEWQERLKKLFTLARIEKGHGHRLRDTFAVSLLEKGVPLQTVSILLGHTSTKTTEKHYSPWVKSRQDALEAAVKLSWGT